MHLTLSCGMAIGVISALMVLHDPLVDRTIGRTTIEPEDFIAIDVRQVCYTAEVQYRDRLFKIGTQCEVIDRCQRRPLTRTRSPRCAERGLWAAAARRPDRAVHTLRLVARVKG